jgi:AcrR family transcriptional regulator
MKRPYRLGKRAETTAETRARILAATEELWRTAGPRATAIAEVARRAGVDRLTVYKHFPDPGTLETAVWDGWQWRQPRPDLTGLFGVEDPGERLRAGLLMIWGWYAETRDLTAWMLRDGPAMPTLLPWLEGWQAWLDLGVDVLARGRPKASALRPTLAVALEFATWERLVGDGWLSPEAAAEVVEGWVRAAEGSP